VNGRRFGRMLLLMPVLGVLGCQDPGRQPLLYEIPAGYTGWVSVQFYRPDCPALPAEGDRQLIRVPRNGQLCTSSALGFGDAKDDYFFVDEAGRRTEARDRIHREHVALEGAAGSPTGKQIFERFFVGTEEDLKRAPPEPKSQ
jgi:hypothetical protein